MDQDGVLVLNQVALKESATGKVPFSVDRIAWRFDVSEAMNGRYGRIAVRGLKVDVDQPQMESLRKMFADTRSETATPQAFVLDHVDLESADIRMAESGVLPAVEFKVEHSSGGFEVDEKGVPLIKDFHLALKDLAVAGNLIPAARVEGFQSGDGRVSADLVHLNGARLAPTAALLKFVNRPSASPAADALSLAPASGPAMYKEVRLRRIELEDFALEGADPGVKMPGWWPQVSGRASCVLKDLTLLESGEISLGSQEIDLRDVELKAASDGGRVLLPRTVVRVSGTRAGGLLHVSEARLDRPVIQWTQGLEDELWPVPKEPAAATAPGGSLRASLVLESLSINDASLDLKRTRRLGYEGRAGLNLKCTSLRVDGSGVSSARPQELALHSLSLAEHLADRQKAFEPFFQLEQGRFSVVPDEFKADSRIALFELTRPVFRVHSESVSWFDRKPAGSDKGQAPASPGHGSVPAWYDLLNITRLQIVDGSVDYAAEHGQRVELRGRLSISTEKDVHRVTLEKIQGLLPQHAKLPVAGVEKIEASVRMPALWQTRRIDALSVEGGELEVGDALMAFGKTTPESDGTSAATASGKGNKDSEAWRVDEISIKDTAITLQRVAPGLPPVKFDINYHAYDLPLAPADLAGNFEPQRVELSQLAIKSPYEPLRNVAYLPTVFVDFTLDGLFQQRIDKVEIVSPSLFVGEDLFWYVDYYRKYAAGEPLPGAMSERMAMAAAGRMMALEAATSAATAPIKEGGAWTVDTLEVHAGKLIIAPKGRPLPGIPRPFPFSFVTRLNQGKLEAQFDIPRDTYTWEQLKIQLEGMYGRVMFNLPVKDVDNNLTETFQVDRIRYKELHMEKAHLTITYDANGIYGKFGGEAYEGYVNGAFNIYNDVNYSWDGWISGSAVKTTEITQKLCPAYLLLDGKVNATVVAQGNSKEVYQCDLKFKNATPGKFSIVALNDTLKAMAKELTGYQLDMATIGIEMLRDLDYEQVAAEARFYGREGKGFLHIAGPAGIRHIDVNVYDHRRHVPGKAASSNIQVSSSTTP